MKTFLNLYANPKRTEKIKLDEEIRHIQDDIGWTQVTNVQLVNIGFVKKPDLLTQIQRHKPVLVHFSGHATEYGEIVLEDVNRQPSLVSPQALEGVFKNFKNMIKLVVLNCCYSEIQAEAISKHIPCVIGMQKALTENTGRIFSSKLLQSLVLGYSIKQSFDMATTELELVHPGLGETPRLIEKRGVEAANLQIVSKPSIHASFSEELQNLGIRDELYKIKLYIKDAPVETSSVVYQFCDDEFREFNEQFKTSNNGGSNFSVFLQEYGDIEIRATLWGGQNPSALSTNLSEALERHYESNSNSKLAAKLIAEIRKY
jgi:hypothetical protein